jgi:hypothetical protein
MAYENVTFFQDEWGLVWALNGDMPPLGQAPRADQLTPLTLPHPEFGNLFSASLLLYKVALNTRAALETWIELLEKHGGDEAVNAFQDIAATLQTACAAAEHGTRKTFQGL